MTGKATQGGRIRFEFSSQTASRRRGSSISNSELVSSWHRVKPALKRHGLSFQLRAPVDGRGRWNCYMRHRTAEGGMQRRAWRIGRGSTDDGPLPARNIRCDALTEQPTRCWRDQDSQHRARRAAKETINDAPANDGRLRFNRTDRIHCAEVSRTDRHRRIDPGRAARCAARNARSPSYRC